jgi:hypothetical protein
MGFVGLPGADNARERIDGVKDTIKGSKIELVDVRADDIDQTRAKATSRTRSPPDRKSTAWSASTPTTRRASTRR